MTKNSFFVFVSGSAIENLRRTNRCLERQNEKLSQELRSIKSGLERKQSQTNQNQHSASSNPEMCFQTKNAKTQKNL